MHDVAMGTDKAEQKRSVARRLPQIPQMVLLVGGELNGGIREADRGTGDNGNGAVGRKARRDGKPTTRPADARGQREIHVPYVRSQRKGFVPGKASVGVATPSANGGLRNSSQK
jgi:hypothetical protein